jgi:phosphate transport system protein
MKLSGNLERIGDKAVNIARKAQELNSGPEMPEVNLLEPAYFEVTSMLNDVLRAYAESDIEIAIGIPLRDQKLDALNQEVTKALTFLMTKRPERIAGSLCLVFISRYLERAGDHIKEIAQDLVYAIAAEDIRHLGDRRPRSAADLLGTSSGDAGGTGGDEILAS